MLVHALESFTQSTPSCIFPTHSLPLHSHIQPTPFFLSFDSNMIVNPLTAATTTTTASSHHHSNKNNNGVPRTIRKRTHLTASQIASLQASFATNPLPDSAIRHSLSMSLGITERTVQIWFQNRRAKARKMDEKINEKAGSTSSSSSSSSLTTTSATSTSTPSTTQTPRYQATFRSLMTPELFEEMKATADSASINGGSLEKRRRPRSASKPEKPKPTPMIPLAPRAMSEETELYRQGNVLCHCFTLLCYLTHLVNWSI